MESSKSFVDIQERLNSKKFDLIIKRIFDIFASLTGIIVLSPLFIIIAIFIKLESKGTVFFKQKRVGRNKKIFEIYKFRTMVTDAEKIGKQITVGNDSRITRFGKIIRKYKMDELPQLINVVKGEMSLVGPRPEVPRYVELYDEYQEQVLFIKPGITDYASIEFKDENEILGKCKNPEEKYIEEIMPYKIELNMKYIRNIGLAQDIKLIFKTIFEVFI